MVRRTFIALVATGLAADVQASGFFVCPGQCEAKFLPRDMDDVDDCSCSSKNDLPSRALLSQSFGDDSSSVYRCPKGASAKALHPKSFDDCLCSDNLHRDEKAGLCVTEITCSGKYALKSGFTSARSLADCDCLDPYTKDESTGECQLTFCPRAANYVKKPSVTQVHSLVDCDCLDPYTKNAQSGECYIRFVCPAHSSPPVQGFAKSIADCTCDWGFVRPQVKSTSSSSSSDPYCVAEKPTFACPPHARPLPTLEGSPQNFMDCECANGYDRLEKLEVCTESVASSSSLRGSNETSAPATVEPFECPDFSMPIAPHPYSMSQCSCLPGFEPNLSLQSCDWTPDYYVCPPHSFNPYPALPPLGFADCHCAKGYQRNDGAGVCIEKDVMGENGCPTGALAKTWPVHDPNWDCFCPHGDSEPDGGDLGAIATSDFMAHLEKQVPVESDWSLRCKNSAVVGFYGCPPNAVMNHWPVLVLEDCSCKAGFDSVAAENDLGMTCNRTTDTFPPCTAGMTRSLVDNVCRFPAEEVSATPRPTSETALSTATSGRIVVNGNELDYVLVEEDIMVTQGDIAVGTSFGYLGGGPESDLLFYVLHGYYNKEKESRWKDATMCFTIDKQVQHRREHIWSAMTHISANTGFRFLECKEEYCDDHLNDCDDLVDFSPTASSCWSSVGRVGGRQMLGVSDDCSQGNLIHVILHAIGLHHPTVRPDRDAHVQIAWECVEAAKRTYLAVEHLEDIYSAEELDIAAVEVPYDYFSIMHHRADAFVNTSMADGGCMSIFPIIQDPYQRQAVMTGMGQREKLSFTDIHYVWVLYPQLKEAMAVQAAASLSDDAADLPTQEYHESRLHTKEDALPYRPASSTSGAVGAVVCVVAVVAIIGFASFEMRRLARKKADTDGSTKYSDPLLSDPIYD